MKLIKQIKLILNSKNKKMAICRNKTLTYLNDLGYNVVRLPRTGIEPLNILGLTGKEPEDLGPIENIWESSFPTPIIESGSASKISGMRSTDFKVSIGISILKKILSGMGATFPKINSFYKKAKKIEFVFSDIKISKISPLKVGKYLAAGDFDLENPFHEFFTEDDRQAFIITEVLKSNQITVETFDKNDLGVELDVKMAEDLINGEIEVTNSTEKKNSITFKGKELLTFGFKCFQIGYIEDDWKLLRKNSKPLFLGEDETETPVSVNDNEISYGPVILGKGKRVNIHSKG